MSKVLKKIRFGTNTEDVCVPSEKILWLLSLGFGHQDHPDRWQCTPTSPRVWAVTSVHQITLRGGAGEGLPRRISFLQHWVSGELIAYTESNAMQSTLYNSENKLEFYSAVMS